MCQTTLKSRGSPTKTHPSKALAAGSTFSPRILSHRHGRPSYALGTSHVAPGWRLLPENWLWRLLEAQTSSKRSLIRIHLKTPRHHGKKRWKIPPGYSVRCIVMFVNYQICTAMLLVAVIKLVATSPYLSINFLCYLPYMHMTLRPDDTSLKAHLLY
ncbi:hypothetical protein EV702DRAFT_1044333 [Suillus placidus]|uniref:Uncharacterized protein n=1 Tax=Suillus placidus TaxID=48579 RepID=A0A9P6ZZA6_9AGAM|nr:hypothetical protein EV702DRAFT_1044333 [Suillus placidus]